MQRVRFQVRDYSDPANDKHAIVGFQFADGLDLQAAFTDGNLAYCQRAAERAS
jgi:hypothetical protein